MKYLGALLIMSVLGLGLVGCDEGPAENFGEDVDEATNDTRDAIDDTADDVENRLEN